MSPNMMHEVGPSNPSRASIGAIVAQSKERSVGGFPAVCGRNNGEGGSVAAIPWSTVCGLL